MTPNSATAMPDIASATAPKVGVGLRHPHYEQALVGAAPVDFVEVHTENFYVEGGANLAVLERARDLYDISLHGTALGLGSAAGIPQHAIDRLARLVERFDPLLVSDHLCFCWADVQGRRVHAGDLLPVQRTREALSVMEANIDRVQNAIGRPLLLENISTYVDAPGQAYSETEFLRQLVQRTGCRLLVDINNLLVNAHNLVVPSPAGYAMAWLDQLPAAAVAEIHLAGYSAPPPGAMAVDDHGAPVSTLAWQVYEYAIERLGKVPTLVEWDTQLPPWEDILDEAARARRIGGAALAAPLH